MIKAFNLPKMKISTADDFVKMERVFDLMREAKNIITFLRDEKGEFRFLYSDLGGDEFLMMAILMNRHIEVFNFIKLVVLDIEKNRQVPCEEHDFTYKALEYIQLKKLSNINFKIQ